MTFQTTSRDTSIRAFLIAVALLLATIFASGPATASTLIPMVDMGGPGGGGGGAAELVPVARSSQILPF